MIFKLEKQDRLPGHLKRREGQIPPEYAQILDLAQVIICDLECRILFWNEGAENLFGWTCDEAVGRFHYELLQTEYSEPLETIFRSLNEHYSWKGELVSRDRDGHVVYVASHWLLHFDHNGDPISILQVNNDITLLKEAENRLLHERNFCDCLIHSLPGIFYLFNSDGKFLRWNNNFEIITGYSHEEFEALHLHDFFPEEERATISTRIEEAFAKGQVSFEAPLLCRDQRNIPFFFTAILMEVEGQNHLVGVGMDITGRKNYEKALQNQRLWLEDVLNFSPSPILFIEPGSGRVTFANQAANMLAGGEFPKGKPTEEYHTAYHCTTLKGDPVPAHDFPTARVARGESVSGYEINWHTPGGIRSLIVYGEILPAMHGHPETGMVVFQDISPLKQAEDSIRQLNVELEQRVHQRTEALKDANAQLQSFAYSVAHDLRAPIRAMQGFSNILEVDYSRKLDQNAREYLQRIQKAATKMDQLILGLLAYSRTSREEIEISPIAVLDLIQELSDKNQHIIRERQVKLEYDSSFPKVMAHRLVLYQAIENIFLNAVKFVDGGVTPEIRIWSETAQGKVRVYIEDNGIGIPPEYSEKIFGIFERLHGNNSYEGTGIGLAIVKKSMERLGGAVGVDSEVAQGSTFWIELIHYPES